MHELVLQVPAQWVDAVSDALMDELDALAVTVEDGDADTPDEQALFGEPGMPPPGPGWRRSTLRALFETEPSATNAATHLMAQDWSERAAGATAPSGELDGRMNLVALAEVADQDWVRLTQSQFEPVDIAPGFWIVPTWHEPPAQAHRVLRLDPGMAFGTGTHPTTAMCAAWIAAHADALDAARVLDYGCGSGILAIAAALHGATQVDAVDIDPAALAATAHNAAANHVEVRTGMPELAVGGYAVVLANILATPLKVLAPLLCAHVAPAGWLVLAGILERQADELRAAYAPWIALEVSATREGWILMTGRQRP